MRKVWSEEAWEDYLYWQTKNYNLSNILKLPMPQIGAVH